MALALHGIGVTFGGVAVLDGVSLAVPDRAVVGLTGRNGAGKTTLLNVVCGLVAPHSGSIVLDGAPLRPRPDRLARLGIARTLQGLGLFESLTVREHVLIGARADRSEELLAELGLGPYGELLPGTLPYGLRKKVALARALAGHPRLLLLDEPASGLEPDEVDALAELVAGLPERGCSVLLVEHDLAFVERVCSDVVALRPEAAP